MELEIAAAAAYDPLKGTKIDGRNLPWDALVAATQADEQVEKGRIARALKMIREYVAPTLGELAVMRPELGEQQIAMQITSRARLYRQRWPGIDLTPLALANNWSRVVTAQPGSDPVSVRDAAQRGLDYGKDAA